MSHPTPGSGDCEVAAERTFLHRGVQFGLEMAAPDFKRKNPNWHRSKPLHTECEWKQGEPARGKKKPFLDGKAKQESARRLPLVGDEDFEDG